MEPAKTKKPRPWTTLIALGFFSWTLIAIAIMVVRSHLRTAPLPTPPTTATKPPIHEPVGWTKIPAALSLSQARDVAFADGGHLFTNGQTASLDWGNGQIQPVEVPASIPRVMSAAGRLFAVGETNGAPFLISFKKGEAPIVVPMPCHVHSLSGDGEIIAGACEGARFLAASNDSGKSFHLIPFNLPKPPVEAQGFAELAIEAVAVGSDGVIAAATSQRWLAAKGSDSLLWTWGQVAVSAQGKPFRFSNVHALVRTVGLSAADGGVTLAGLENTSFEGPNEGELRARIFRGAVGEPPLPVGEPGPRCGHVLDANSVKGVLIGTHIAAFLCQEQVVLTLDGGASWKTEPDLNQVRLLKGGDMRLMAFGPTDAWERRFMNRSEIGATAIRISGENLAKFGLGGVGQHK